MGVNFYPAVSAGFFFISIFIMALEKFQRFVESVAAGIFNNDGLHKTRSHPMTFSYQISYPV